MKYANFPERKSIWKYLKLYTICISAYITPQETYAHGFVMVCAGHIDLYVQVILTCIHAGAYFTTIFLLLQVKFDGNFNWL